MAQLKCFVMMPYDDCFEPVFEAVREATTGAAPGEVIHCHWLRDVHRAGRICDEIVRSIHEAAVCIADVTDNNPNVMWEAGYATALRKLPILIGPEVALLPFNLKDCRIVTYSPDALDRLKDPLGKAVCETLGDQDIPSGFRVSGVLEDQGIAIAVTGSMRASARRVERRIPALLEPYLSPSVLWYCGSYGTVDEVALRYLIAHKQRVVAVGYHGYDLSEAVRGLVESEQAKFLDASVESLPKGLPGPNARDILFAAKADLIVLLWDGVSTGTGQLVQYYHSNAKNCLVGFI